jgi:hypothetical protein
MYSIIPFSLDLMLYGPGQAFGVGNKRENLIERLGGSIPSRHKIYRLRPRL